MWEMAVRQFGCEPFQGKSATDETTMKKNLKITFSKLIDNTIDGKKVPSYHLKIAWKGYSHMDKPYI